MLYPASSREARLGQRIRERLRNGLLAIDVLAGFDRTLHQLDPHLRRARIEKYLVVRIGERGAQVRRVAGDIVASRELGDFVGVARRPDRCRWTAA